VLSAFVEKPPYLQQACGAFRYPWPTMSISLAIFIVVVDVVLQPKALFAAGLGELPAVLVKTCFAVGVIDAQHAQEELVHGDMRVYSARQTAAQGSGGSGDWLPEVLPNHRQQNSALSSSSSR
jgi:hypothetical protein